MYGIVTCNFQCLTYCNSVIYKVFSTLTFMVNIPHNNQMSVYTHTCVMKWNIAIAGIMPRSSYAFMQGVPLDTESGISLILLTPMKILQRNLNRSMFVVWEMKRKVSVVCFKFRCNILISGKIIKVMPGSVASGAPCITAKSSNINCGRQY